MIDESRTMSEPTDAQVEAAALGWINEVRRQNGLMPIKTVPKRDRDDWLPRARAALMAARQSIQDGTALVRQFNEWTPPDMNNSSNPLSRKPLDAALVGKVNADAMKALGDVHARRKWGESNSGSPVTTNILCAEIARLNLAMETARPPPDTLQSQLADVAPYYSPVATAMARIKELEAALEALLVRYEALLNSCDFHEDTEIEVRDQARAALSKGEQGAT